MIQRGSGQHVSRDKPPWSLQHLVTGRRLSRISLQWRNVPDVINQLESTITDIDQSEATVDRRGQYGTLDQSEDSIVLLTNEKLVLPDHTCLAVIRSYRRVKL